MILSVTLQQMHRVSIMRAKRFPTFTESIATKKEAAFRYCKWIFNKYRKYQAFDFAIRSHNTFTFTVNFKFVNPLNGCIMIAVITKYKNQLYFA